MISIKGNLIFAGTSRLLMDMENASSFDHLEVTGSVTLTGDLIITWPDSYTPASGMEFIIITWSGSRRGAFVDISHGTKNIVTDAVYNTNDLTLKVK